MTSTVKSPSHWIPALRWKLWVDGCGGFLLLVGDRFTVGGPTGSVDIRVHADWPRAAGTIERKGADYFWLDSASETETQTLPTQTRTLLANGASLPIAGSATATLTKPSPLSDSGVIGMRPPHRFDEHLDAVILVQETLLIGNGQDNHIRCRDIDDQLVIVCRDGSWFGKLGFGRPPAKGNPCEEMQPLTVGERFTLGGVSMTLEQA